MSYSANSVAPASSNAVPSVSVPPPVTTLIPTQGHRQLSNYPIRLGSRSTVSVRRWVFTSLGGVLISALVGVSLAVPVVLAVNATTRTTQTTTTVTTITTTSATTITTTSATTSSSTTSTTSSTTTMGPLQWNTTGSTVAGQAGSTSATPYYFNLPIGIWVDSSTNRLYVADGNNHRIQRFTLGNTTGTTVAGSATGVVGANATLLNYPNDIAVDSSGNIYVVDSYNNRVQLWYANATSGVTIAGNGTAGNATVLNWPRAIAFGANTSTFFISDSNNSRVMMYTLGSTVGTIVAGGNGGGLNRNQLSNPRGLYYESSTNSLVIANTGAHNIVRWVIGASNWTLVAGNANGTIGNGSSSFNGPWDVTLDALGNVYVADRYNQRIQFFLANQTNGTTIAGATGVLGSTTTRLYEPLSVTVDSQYNLYVSDSFNYRMQKFSHM